MHELKLIEEAKVLAKKRNCKSVAQLVRKVVWNEIHQEKKHAFSFVCPKNHKAAHIFIIFNHILKYNISFGRVN